MKKRVLVFFVMLATVFALNACNSSNSLGPGDMLDTDTEQIFSLGDPRKRFDDSFSYLGTDESDGPFGLEVEYLSGILTVTYHDDIAVSIQCDGGTNRFEFYNFDFSMDISEIIGRYDKSTTSGFIFYSRYYDDDGKDVSFYDSTIFHTLMVRDGDLLNMKDGQYLHYSISDDSFYFS